MNQNESQNPAANPNPVGPASNPVTPAPTDPAATDPAANNPVTPTPTHPTATDQVATDQVANTQIMVPPPVKPEVCLVPTALAEIHHADLASDAVSFTVKSLPDGTWTEEQLIEFAYSQWAEICACRRKTAIHIYIFGAALSVLHESLTQSRKLGPAQKREPVSAGRKAPVDRV